MSACKQELMFGHLCLNSVYNFVGFFPSCFIGNWPKESFVTRGSDFLAIGHQKNSKV